MNSNSSNRRYAGALLADEMPENSIDNLLCRDGIDVEWLLHEAADRNLVETMIELVDRYGADVNEYSIHWDGENRSCPLYMAVRSGSIAALEFLLSRGADPNGRSEEGFQFSQSVPAFLIAAENGNVRIAQLLIEAGVDINAPKNSTNNTPLYLAVQNGNTAMINLLIRNNANLEKRNNQGNPPMLMAIGANRLDIVAQLLNAGVSIPDKAEGALSHMRQTNSCLCPDFKQRISDEELDILDELLHPICNLQNNPTYLKARAAEMEGKYRDALCLYKLVDDSSGGKVQLKFDIERNIEAIFGVKGSDARISSWEQVPVMSETEPKELQFYAWTQFGRKVYIHGGINFMTQELLPSVDELWSFDIDTRKYSKLKTSGETPGPRCGHTMFVYDNALYLWGGQSGRGITDSKLYRLSLDKKGTLTWEKVKTKTSLTPSPRQDHSGVLYKGKYYLSGGFIDYQNLENDLWCLDMKTYKWSTLRRGPKERKSHGMWAAHGKLYVLAGRTIDRNIAHPIEASRTIDSFDLYDIKKNEWTSVAATGYTEEHPFDISEFTVLPLYHGDIKDEPTSIIVWGGFTEKRRIIEKEIRKYGNIAKEFLSSPYRNRMLRFDIKTQTWNLLSATTDILPKALSFAAEVQCDKGKVKLIIGRGYGLAPEGGSDLPVVDPIATERYKAWMSQSGTRPVTPIHSNNIYEVSIADVTTMCFANDNLSGKSWPWEFFDVHGEKCPSTSAVFISPVSNTLHRGADCAFEDFLQPPCDSVEPNNDSLMLGVRVKFHGLQGRKDLNGSGGRCGLWQPKSQRYQIFIPPYENGGPAILAVKPSNLLISKPVDEKSLSESPKATFFPILHMATVAPKTLDTKTRSLLDYILKEGGSWNCKGIQLLSDTYYGPVSAKAMSILRSVAADDTIFKKTLYFDFIPPGFKTSTPNRKGITENDLRKANIYTKFCSELKKTDRNRVNAFKAKLSKKSSPITNLGPWLKLDITLDGIQPKIHRELIVNPSVSMQNLHHQILCPAIGWSSNFHCYAFRKVHPMVNMHTTEEIYNTGGYTKQMGPAIKMMKEECWIGPKKSTALDQIFQPLYIGGALANDKKIKLGELFMLDEKDVMHLQYVHNFGDWWSHTIRVSTFDGEVPNEISTVAHILSGSGCSPPENVGGVDKYMYAMKRLTGKEEIEKNDKTDNPFFSYKVDPCNERWWSLLNEAVRRHPNGVSLANPIEFNLENARAKLETAIHRPNQAIGGEFGNVLTRHFETGLASEKKTKDINSEKPKDPKKMCAVCGVTVALKLCSGCKSVSFCSREHQIEYWPRHKKECQRIKRERTA